jgi:hypothetical protein
LPSRKPEFDLEIQLSPPFPNLFAAVLLVMAHPAAIAKLFLAHFFHNTFTSG